MDSCNLQNKNDMTKHKKLSWEESSAIYLANLGMV